MRHPNRDGESMGSDAPQQSAPNTHTTPSQKNPTCLPSMPRASSPSRPAILPLTGALALGAARRRHRRRGATQGGSREWSECRGADQGVCDS
eukprot:9482499-Pyramimonas_sp.AAC.1